MVMSQLIVCHVVDMDVVEFEDADSASSSDMDEYESEDELGDMFCSPRNQKHKKPQPAKTSAAGKSQTKSCNTTASSMPRPDKPHVASKPLKPPVSSKPVKLSSSKLSASAASTKLSPAAAATSDNVGSFLGMKEYMDAMDRELARTTVGKSFVQDGDTV